MNSLRKILYPFSLIYGAITGIRNWLFDAKILTSASYDLPVITVGNLNVGGTGKSPMIEYLIRLLDDSLKIAVLSRGYGRKTKGFYQASEKSTAKELGDEPFQFFRKFDDLIVVVDEKRVQGMNKLLASEEPEVVLLDDAFQHRQIRAGFSIILTAFDKLYSDDMLLPAGNLRESKSGAKRADVIVVSKCPLGLTEEERQVVIKKIKPLSDQKVFFSGIKYDNWVYDNEQKIPVKELIEWGVLLVTGIADAKPLENFLSDNQIDFDPIKFSDHQFIDDIELLKIRDRFNALPANKKIILTTEKDYVRSFLNISLPIFYLPIRSEILQNKDDFNELILNYVRKN